jgi:TnpA family transposase
MTGNKPPGAGESRRVCAVIIELHAACSASIWQKAGARGLNLLVAAIVLWNSRYLGEAVDALRRHGHDIADELLAHVWPLASGPHQSDR